MNGNGCGNGTAPFHGSIERVGDRLTVVAPRGDLDAYSYDGFRGEISSVVAGDLVVDLTDVTFIDSLALGVVVQASKRCRARGDTLTVVSSDAHTRKVIEVTGLTRVLRLERSLADAVSQTLTR